MKRRLSLFLAALLIPTFFCFAQNVDIKVSSDSTHYLIGDHVHISIDISTSPDGRVEFPQFIADMFPPLGLDWIKSSPIDTTVDEYRKKFHQTITITSFDTGRYTFPSVEVVGSDSTILAVSNPVHFEIQTVGIDTTAQLRDIKQPVKVPLTFKEVLPYIIIVMVAAVLIGLVVLLVLKMRIKKKKPAPSVKPKPKIRPDIAALAALENLWIKKLWQTGMIKAYYSELTEIIRTYLDECFGIDAMEMVSAEILEAVQGKDISPEAYTLLKELLSTADLVKFAKWNPIPDDHNRCFSNAKRFVELTAVKNENNKPEEPNK
ncbi:hypothetical protein LJC68_03645 [Bacteroidales bacterium OttesenSCG-928-B11]|nr:hypothetical protein [Bacteroidales bacterium OttesenSCG-928-B11]